MADGKPKLLGISTRGNQTPLEIRRSTLATPGTKAAPVSEMDTLLEYCLCAATWKS